MELSIIVPVYNEEQTISQVVSKLFALKLPCTYEVVIVDDGSTDGTYKKISNINYQISNKDENFKIIKHKKNKGKGEAIKTGIKAATGDYILIQDADLEYNPLEISKLLQPIIKNPKTKIAVYGSRFKEEGKAKISPIYYFGNKFLTTLTNLLYRVNLTDMETGYKLLPISFMKSIKLTASHFEVEPEITAKLIKAGIRIVEVPISYEGRSHLAGKKLTIADAFAAIKILVMLKFT